MLQKFQYPNLSVLPHGRDGVAVRLPNDVRDEIGLTTTDAVEAEFDRERKTLTFHFKE